MGMYNSSKYCVRSLMQFTGYNSNNIQQLLKMVRFYSNLTMKNICTGEIIEIVLKQG